MSMYLFIILRLSTVTLSLQRAIVRGKREIQPFLLNGLCMWPKIKIVKSVMCYKMVNIK